MPMIVRSQQQFRGAAPAGIREDGRMQTIGLRAQAGSMRVQARDTARTAGVFGEAIGQVGEMLRQRDENVRQARAAAQKTDAILKARQALDEAEIAIEQSNSFDGVLENFDESAVELRQRLVEGVSDPATAQAVAQDLDEIIRQRRAKIRRAINAKEIDFQTAKLDADLIDLAAEAAGAVGDERDLLVDTATDRLATAVRTGIMQPTDMLDRLQDFRNDLDEADVRRLISTAPEAAIQALDDPDKFRALAPDRRAVLADMAVTRLGTKLNQERRDDERAEREREKAEKAAADAAMKTIRAAGVDGTLTRDMIEGHREILSASEYGTALKILAGDGEGGRQDSETLVDLYTRVNYVPDQAEQAAIEAFADGRINQATLNTITARAESARERKAADDRREVKPPRDLELAEDFLKRALRPSGLMNDEAANERYAEGVLRFQEQADAMLAAGKTDGFQAVARQVVKQSGNALGGTAALPLLNYAATPRSFRNPAEVQSVLRRELTEIGVREARREITRAEAQVMRAVVGSWAAELKRRVTVGGSDDAE